MTGSNRLSGRLLVILIIGVVAMATGSIFVRKAQSEMVPSLVIAAYRMTIATLVVSVPFIVQKKYQEYLQLGKREFMGLIASGIFLGLHFATWVTSLAHTSVLSSIVLVTTTPLWIGIASPLVLHERTARRVWIGIVIATLGAIVIGYAGQADPVGSDSTVGNLLALGGAIFGAAYILIGRRSRAMTSFISYVWIVYLTAAVMLVCWALTAGFKLTGYSPMALVWLIALGLIPQSIGHSSANYAVRFLSASLVGTFTLGEPIGSTILAIFVLDEVPAGLQVVGGLVTLLGIAVASSGREKQPRRVEDQTEVETTPYPDDSIRKVS